MKDIKTLLKLEWEKTFWNGSFRAIIATYTLLFLMVVLIGSQVGLNINGVRVDKLFVFPHVWQTLSWIASWFNLLLGILMIVLVTSEFQFRTFRKQLIDGISRPQLLIAKGGVAVILALFVVAITLTTAITTGLLMGNAEQVSAFSGIEVLLVLFIQALAYLVLGILISFSVKNTALSILSFILLFFPIEPIIRAFFSSETGAFFPMKSISDLTPMPDFFGIAAGDLIQINQQFTPEGVAINEPTISWISTITVVVYIALFSFALRAIVAKRNF